MYLCNNRQLAIISARVSLSVHWRLAELALLDAGAHSCPLSGDLHLIPAPTRCLERSVLVCLSWSVLLGLLFSLSTALLTTKSLHRPRLWYSTARLLIPRHTRLYYSQRSTAASRHPDTDTLVKTCHCCSPLRASQTRQSAQKLEGSKTPLTSANARPISYRLAPSR